MTLPFLSFIPSILSLYLSRISNSEGIIFTYSNLNSNDTLFNIKYNDESSLLDFIFTVKSIMNKSLDNSMENLKEHVRELHPDYIDYIFNYTIVDAENNSKADNTDSIIKFIIYNDSIEIQYDTNTFEKIEIESMLENIESIIKNCLNDPNQLCCDVDIVCNRQMELINEFSKGDVIDIDDKPFQILYLK